MGHKCGSLVYAQACRRVRVTQANVVHDSPTAGVEVEVAWQRSSVLHLQIRTDPPLPPRPSPQPTPRGRTSDKWRQAPRARRASAALLKSGRQTETAVETAENISLGMHTQ